MKKAVIITLSVFTALLLAGNLYWFQKLNKLTIKETPGETPVETRLELNEILNACRSNTITDAVKKIKPSVVSVNVITTTIGSRYVRPFDHPFFGFLEPYRKEDESIGSGVIIDEEGHIITNSHVVEEATSIKVRLNDGREYSAELIGVDTINDIAIIKINGKKLPVATLGSSDDLIIGEWAIAVGNPYALVIKASKPSVSVGVISALERNFVQNSDGKIYKKMIQTDAAINPGNSGGPLVNILGEVIGINTFIFSESGGSIGIGFALPIDRVKKIAFELINYGEIRKRRFGFLVQDITKDIMQYLDLKTIDGVIVSSVEKNGPAGKSGLKPGDIILKIDNMPVKSAKDANLAVSDVTIGEQIELEVLRGKKTQKLTIITEEYK